MNRQVLKFKSALTCVVWSLFLVLFLVSCDTALDKKTDNENTGDKTKTLQSITISPANPSVAVGANQQFAATGTYSDASTADITASATWSSTTPVVAAIGADNGLFSGVSAGTSKISATLGTISGETILTVTAVGTITVKTLQSITISPANPSVAVGANQQFAATGTYSDASTADITASVTWASNTTIAASINSSGLATGVSAGTAKISATSGAISGDTTLTINMAGTTATTLQSITVTPANPSITVGATQQFVATGTYSDGSASIIPKNSVAWTSSAPSVASISTNGGKATGFSAGTTKITAIGGIETNPNGTTFGETTLTVTAAAAGSGTETVTDIDGNIYHTVTIGTQVWMVENLKTTKYNDGTVITLVTDNTAWENLKTPGYSWYLNDESTYKNIYGALYNWYAVNTGKIAPAGWHVATDAEWTTLTKYLGGGSDPYKNTVGDKLREIGDTHWASTSATVTNETGFTALPGGDRRFDNSGSFRNIKADGNWWTATSSNNNDAWYRYIRYNNSSVYTNTSELADGFSVRCVKD